MRSPVSKAAAMALGALILGLSAAPTRAQVRETAAASVRVENAVGVTVLARMAFARVNSSDEPPRPGEATVTGATGSTASAPAVIRVTGDPGRTYRVNLPRSFSAPTGQATISQFRVWSQNSGDISETLTAHMDLQGQDTLRVTGVLSAVTFVDVTAAMPVTVNYE